MNMTSTDIAAPHPPVAGIADGTGTRRLVALLAALGAAAVLGLATWMEPAEAGLGTHTQLNMPPCAWILAVDLPCPTCGMTTAFAHAAEGDLASSFAAQPMGAVLAVAAAITLLVGIYTALTGSRVALLFQRLWGRRAVWALAIGVVAAWAYKIVSYKGMLG